MTFLWHSFFFYTGKLDKRASDFYCNKHITPWCINLQQPAVNCICDNCLKLHLPRAEGRKCNICCFYYDPYETYESTSENETKWRNLPDHVPEPRGKKRRSRQDRSEQRGNLKRSRTERNDGSSSDEDTPDKKRKLNIKKETEAKKKNEWKKAATYLRNMFLVFIFFVCLLFSFLSIHWYLFIFIINLFSMKVLLHNYHMRWRTCFSTAMVEFIKHGFY